MNMKKTMVVLLMALAGATAQAQLLTGVPARPAVDNNDEGEFFCDPVELSPSFPGGDKAVLDFVKKNLRFPQEAARTVKEARLFMQFIVNLDGTLSDFKPIRLSHIVWKHPYESFDNLPEEQQEAMKAHLTTLFAKEGERMLLLMPKWTPGSIMNKDVRMRCTFPLTFRQEDTAKDKYVAKRVHE